MCEEFDLIIGNPPYIHFNQLSPEIANSVKKIVKTKKGNIYYAFIIKSIPLLKNGGEFIYIVPYHFFYNTYAKIVREMLLKFGKIEIIIDLDEVKLFNNGSPETIIFKFKKGEYNLKNEKIKLLNIKKRKTNSLEIYEKVIDALSSKTSNELFNYSEISHYLTSKHWSTFILNTPDFPSVKLKDIAKVGVGLISGIDKAFIIKKEQEMILKFNNYETNLIKKFVKAKNCKRFIIDGYKSYIVIDDSINSENLLMLLYPNIYQKILPFKEKMLKRYLPKYKMWFHWQALRNYKFLISNLNKKRIYAPALDRCPYNRFSLGEENLLPSCDVLFIQPHKDEDLYFLLGYLNSTLFREYYLAKGGRKGGRIFFTQKLLENAEIPLFKDKIIEEINKLTKEIVLKLKEGNDVSLLEKKLNNLIYSSFRDFFKKISD